MIDFDRGAPVAGDLDVAWHAGSPSAKHDTADEIQSHHYSEHTVIMRQNKAVHYEAPFMFLLFGNDRAVLIDTGATPKERFFPLRATVDAHIDRWLERHPRPDYGLLVAHTHGHGDHKAADGQFTDRPNTVVVGTDLDEVVEFYGFTDWPDTSRTLDLGGRRLEVIPGPGHHPSATVFYDPHTGLLLTGDTLYPGRLYVDDWQDFGTTFTKLREFCANHPVTHVLGCHIEMSRTPSEDYPIRTVYQPEEPPLQLSVSDVNDVCEAIEAIGDSPGIHRYDRFIIHRGH
ncbi:MBL fold metallo-hydrolase [Stackebrandtia nassauensis]|uniref:Beta-lactamase domain protein n=1 Tax=Stackebrandtia nassauensis (strain DSM 44728 / CIP 108903 / NRRL B-16338 / NBRC 102104 / LLR-40K-21) TaxID=446470 RepID=D3PWS4_STANL|nr:MBL fold metallo-hydrolase [Stackebrandtia nassauensis]ADD43296.1 beta-lactamase domain protein [Stackebrandtia nassauensis DSM 44728]